MAENPKRMKTLISRPALNITFSSSVNCVKINQISLPAEALPKNWYNIAPDLPEPLPPPKEPGDGSSRMEFLGRLGDDDVQRNMGGAGLEVHQTQTDTAKHKGNYMKQFILIDGNDIGYAQQLGMTRLSIGDQATHAIYGFLLALRKVANTQQQRKHSYRYVGC